VDSADNIVRFPIKPEDWRRNSLGSQAIPCWGSRRWFRLDSNWITVGEERLVRVDVMSGDQKMCSLTISQRHLMEALANVAEPATPEPEDDPPPTAAE
jgi:hypothetical protein